ncbi:MAG: TIGR04348 family glycosyltransferase [Pseudomonadota bacterium]|nr:TIGR04348 family glycosyltransferase [Pseudomonadota bacterium]
MPQPPSRQPRVCIVTPALAAANNGNWQTASRWQRFLAPVAQVEVRGAADADPDASADILIALHAHRSAEAIARFRARRPSAGIGLVLTGTDLYGDLETDRSARHSLQCASAIVVLQECGLDRLDAAARAKARVIVQSARSLSVLRHQGDADFVAVGHLRAEKDPETLMAAARLLGSDGGERLTIDHFGASLDPRFAALAEETMRVCPWYRWRGAVPHGAARRAIGRARALVHCSRLEGGANVVIEAVRSGVPVLASRIDGNLGLLGRGYTGAFPVGDAAALAMLMRRFVDDADFAAQLRDQCAGRAPLFSPAAERAAVRHLVADLLDNRGAAADRGR